MEAATLVLYILKQAENPVFVYEYLKNVTTVTLFAQYEDQFQVCHNQLEPTRTGSSMSDTKEKCVACNIKTKNSIDWAALPEKAYNCCYYTFSTFIVPNTFYQTLTILYKEG